ncbi:ABC transporter permease [Butyrivibrio sp. MC2013]|uniref:ABC transporter permease n=1 Tax=Butyrivibrio sp. MC2013 TaxID=1280686 RepID=UPI00040274F0|nr:ABC transporter permease [Butyrivibrio sp. MC2013]
MKDKKLSIRAGKLLKKIRELFCLARFRMIVLPILIMICIILTLVRGAIIRSMLDQNAYMSWDSHKSYGQVTAFFAEKAMLSAGSIKEIEYNLDKAMTENSIKSENGERLFKDCYSAIDNVNVGSTGKTSNVRAVGVGGDFFLFHELKLVNGSFFDKDNEMKDLIVIDEDLAWSLFGSDDVQGKTVLINDIPHIISGVVARQRGRISDAAGLDRSVIYMSYESLYAMNETPVGAFEVMLPEKVDGFGMRIVSDKLDYDESDMTIVDNRNRFGLSEMVKVFLSFPSRSMQLTDYKLPYWENIARAAEDIISILQIFILASMVLAFADAFSIGVVIYRNKGFTARSIINGIADKVYAWQSKRRPAESE